MYTSRTKIKAIFPSEVNMFWHTAQVLIYTFVCASLLDVAHMHKQIIRDTISLISDNVLIWLNSILVTVKTVRTGLEILLSESETLKKSRFHSNPQSREKYNFFEQN